MLDGKKTKARARLGLEKIGLVLPLQNTSDQKPNNPQKMSINLMT